MKYKLKHQTEVTYEVEANSEDEALKIPIPKTGHRASISVLKDNPIIEYCNCLGSTFDKHCIYCNKIIKVLV